MDAVANIHELFEDILDLLPFLDLVIASRVNRTFHNFITKSSKKLRRKLFRLSTKSATPEDNMDKWGVVGRFMSCRDCLFNKEAARTLDICPYLLNRSSRYLRTAHLSERAVAAPVWPEMFLTNPPCAHAVVTFVYTCNIGCGVNLVLEATRSLYRRRGVTFLAVEEALSQTGAVRTRQSNQRKGNLEQATTVYEMIRITERTHKRKMHLDRKLTTIRLHGNPLPTEEERIVRWD